MKADSWRVIVMMAQRLFLAIFITTLPLGGCLMPTSGSDAGAPNTGATSDAGASSIPSGNATGSGCGTDPTTGVTLCVGTSLCPDISVDESAFPECGFRINGNILDLECLCSGYLCPVGVATTCAQVSQLLSAQNEGVVCNAVTNNACAQLTTASAGSTATNAQTADSGSGSGCDTNCEANCAGEPDCIQLCGC